MARKKSAVFVDVEPELTPEEATEPEAPESSEPADVAEPTEVPERRPEPPQLKAAREKVRETIRKKSLLTKIEVAAKKKLKEEKAVKHREELDRLLKEHKEDEKQAAAVKTQDPTLSPEMKLFLKNKAQKYVQQAMVAMAFHQPAAVAAAPVPSPAEDVRMIARGRVQTYLTEQSMREAMSSIFPNGGYK